MHATIGQVQRSKMPLFRVYLQPGMMQMMRMMELLAHTVLRHANTASLHVRLELQSSAETKEMVNMRQLLDGCLEVYKNDTRSRGGMRVPRCTRNSPCPYAKICVTEMFTVWHAHI